ncbi:MAG: hypothetical protein IJ833_03850 [Lachnospiraceae bacterium]|nr:hypothetical protein [Lachnospiraceae bacterium]
MSLCKIAAILLCGIAAGVSVGKGQVTPKSFEKINIGNYSAVVDAARKGLKEHSPKITIAFTAHSDITDDIEEIAKSVMEDALADTQEATEGDYIRFQYGGYETRYSYVEDGGQFKYTVKLIPYYYTDLEQEAYVSEQIAQIIDSFAFDADTSDYEKVKTVYDYIYKQVAYDRVHQYQETNHLKTTAYAALKYHTAVCQGYSVLLYRMLREVGVDARVITGTGVMDEKSEFHAWNIVRIDGVYYNLDVTWGKALETDQFFLKSDAHFEGHLREDRYNTREFRERYVMSDRDYEIPNP